jgi:hypothetical protein
MVNLSALIVSMVFLQLFFIAYLFFGLGGFLLAGHRALAPCPAVSSHFQAISSRLDHERGRVFAVRVWIRRVLRLEVHAQPHNCFLDLGGSEAAFTRRAHGVVWRTFSGVAFITAFFEALEAFVEVFAPLLRLIHEGFLLVWCWFHYRLFFLVTGASGPNGEQGNIILFKKIMPALPVIKLYHYSRKIGAVTVRPCFLSIRKNVCDGFSYGALMDRAYGP